MIEPNGRTDVRMSVYGSAGTMIAMNPLAPQNGASITIETDSGREVHEVDSSATYLHQLVAFRDAGASGVHPVTSGATHPEQRRIIIRDLHRRRNRTSSFRHRLTVCISSTGRIVTLSVVSGSRRPSPTEEE